MLFNRLLIFLKNNLFEKLSQEYHQSVNSDQQFIQFGIRVDTSRQRVNKLVSKFAIFFIIKIKGNTKLVLEKSAQIKKVPDQTAYSQAVKGLSTFHP